MEHKDIDREIELLKKQHPDTKLRTFEEVEIYFRLAAATCEFTSETENRYWDRVFRLATPELKPYDIGRALQSIVAASIMAGGMGSAKYVMPEAVHLIADPAWALAEFADVFVLALEKLPGERRLSLIEAMADACANPEELLNEDDVNSFFRNLKALVHQFEIQEGSS